MTPFTRRSVSLDTCSLKARLDAEHFKRCNSEYVYLPYEQPIRNTTFSFNVPTLLAFFSVLLLAYNILKDGEMKIITHTASDRPGSAAYDERLSLYTATATTRTQVGKTSPDCDLFVK